MSQGRLFDDRSDSTLASLVIYEGNWPSNVNKDAKYSVKSEEGKHVIEVKYRSKTGENWYPTNANHDELVAMINRIKVAVNGVPGGPFYITEFQQVIVPVGSPVKYYYAGPYTTPLEFDIEGHRLSGRAYDLEGGPLCPGAIWEGIHQGIPYKVSPKGDIYYENEIRPKVKKEVWLGDSVGEQRARQMASKLMTLMGGFEGGRIYVNEFRQLFTGMPYKYLGELQDDDPWFPRPHSST